MLGNFLCNIQAVETSNSALDNIIRNRSVFAKGSVDHQSCMADVGFSSGSHLNFSIAGGVNPHAQIGK